MFIYMCVCVCVCSLIYIYIYIYMGHSTELVQSQSWKFLEKKKVFSPKICMYANCIISKVHISSNCAVNSHIVFSEKK